MAHCQPGANIIIIVIIKIQLPTGLLADFCNHCEYVCSKVRLVFILLTATFNIGQIFHLWFRLASSTIVFIIFIFAIMFMFQRMAETC